MSINFVWKRNLPAYILSGIICMFLVIWIARTSWFYLCYLPVIFSAFYLSLLSNRGKGLVLPSKMIRLLSFIGGMIISEIIFFLALIARNEIFFNMHKSGSDLTLLAIELILGVFVFILFFGLSVAIRFFFIKK